MELEYDRGADMSSTTQTVSKNERDVIAAEISEILKDVPIVGYRDEKGVLVLPADDDEDYRESSNMVCLGKIRGF